MNDWSKDEGEADDEDEDDQNLFEENFDLPDPGARAALSQPSDVELGKYRALVQIGSSAMADVFVAVARGPAGFNKLLVIKRLHAATAGDAGYRQMFLEEARLAAGLTHPNVVQTYEVSEHDGEIFIATEYLEGQPLDRIMSALGKLHPSIAHPLYVRLICDVLAGLHHAHELHDFDGTPLRVVHRDVSPQNIFITYEGRVLVLDFGIAKAECSERKTQTGVLKGKVGYMAPEQLLTDAIDRRVDIFTTGTVLWELLTGARLMSAPSIAKILVKLLNAPIPRVSERVPAVDPRLDAIVARALERMPEDRFATASEMRHALDEYLVSVAGSGAARVEELGQIMVGLFAEERAKLDLTIRGQLAAVSAPPRSGATVTSGSIEASRSSFTGLGMTRRPLLLADARRGAREGDDAHDAGTASRNAWLFGAALILLVASASLANLLRRAPSSAGAAPLSSPVVVSTIAGPRATGAPATTGARVTGSAPRIPVVAEPRARPAPTPARHGGVLAPRAPEPKRTGATTASKSGGSAARSAATATASAPPGSATAPAAEPAVSRPPLEPPAEGRRYRTSY